jgi:hypothetical protein
MRDHRGEIVTNRKQTTSQPNSTANYPNSNYACMYNHPYRSVTQYGAEFQHV